jgi:pPIWI_RE three-gene island domain Y/REase associating with pPIWI_RE
MPKYPVSEEVEQDALLGHRHLLPPSEAATLLRISRQAVEKSAARPRGQILVWAFDALGGRRRYRPFYVDFGPRNEQFDSAAWQRHQDDLAAIVRQAVSASRDLSADALGKATVTHDAGHMPSAGGRPAVDDDSLLILHLVASGIVQFDRRLHREPWRLVPYPDALQKGLDKLTVRCLKREAEPPASVPDLLGWCRERPLYDWVLDLGEEIADRSDRLLDGPQPTAFCQEWAVDSRDVESEVIERRLLHGVIATCRQAGDQDGYVAFRRLLIEKPVLTTLQLHVECARPELSRLAEEVRKVYAPAPLEYAESHAVVCCATCGNLLLRSPGGMLHCGDDRCARETTTVGRRISLAEDPLWLELPFRTFVTAPGRAELWLAKRLERLGVSVELWPEFDAYDLRVGFPDGEAWAVDVKDWASPVALARHLDRVAELVPTSPPWQRAFFVFPQDRLRRRPDYVRAFVNASRALARSPKVAALGEGSFVDAVRRHLRSPQGVR